MAVFRKRRSRPPVEPPSSRLQHPLWLQVLASRQRVLEAEDDIDRLSARAWNRIVDEHAEAVRALAGDGALVDQVWALALDELGEESQVATDVLRTGLRESFDPSSTSALEDHPLLRLDPGDLHVAPAVFLVEKEEVELERDFWDEERRPSLSRIGGFPTQVRDRPHPEGEFLLQLDLADLEPGWSNLDVEAVLETYPSLPHGGLLQVFGLTDSDTSTAPERPGGGVTLVYLSEDDLALERRLPHPTPSDPARQLDATARHTIRPRPDADDEDVFAKAAWLHESINATVSRMAEDSFDNETAPPASRLFGLQHPDFELSEDDQRILEGHLPLTGTDDQHCLLLQVSSLGVLDECFGDSGFLEIWVRDSDLRSQDFGHVVSFIRSA